MRKLIHEKQWEKRLDERTSRLLLNFPIHGTSKGLVQHLE
jgi:hypothetical protein